MNSIKVLPVALLTLACSSPSSDAPGVDGGAVVDAGGEPTAACKFPTNFSRSAGNPMAMPDIQPWPIISDPHVAWEDDRFRMWFTTGDWSDDAPWWDGGPSVAGTSYTESEDGIHWDLDLLAPTEPGRQIAQVLTPGAWNPKGVETASVVRTPEGGYRLYHTGDMNDTARFAIGLATSADGISFEPHGDAAVFDWENDWEQPVCLDAPACTMESGGVLEPTVLYDEAAGEYRMWYAGVGDRGGVYAYRIGHATSADGLSWTRHPTPVFEPGAAGTWDDAVVSHTHVTADPVKGYHLFYFGANHEQEMTDCGFFPGGIGHAYSEDGVTWERNPANPVLAPSAGEWDGFVVGGPSALVHEGSMYLWYFGSRDCEAAGGLHFELGLAQAACG